MADPRQAYHWLYKTKRWLALRAYQLAIEPLCRRCKSMGRIVAATTADHVEPHKGNPEKFYNGALQSLCTSCHSGAKQSEERTGRKRVDPLNPWGGRA